jgi:hypothetical protein
LKLSGTPNIFVYTKDVNISGRSVQAIEESTEALVFPRRENRLEVNVDKAKYTVVSRDQNARRNHNIKIDNRTVGRVEQFTYLGTTLTTQTSIQEGIKRKLKAGNAYYHSVQNLLSFSLLSKHLKIRISRYIILFVVFYGDETWSLTLREQRRMTVFENRELKRIFGPRRDELKEGAGSCITRR